MTNVHVAQPAANGRRMVKTWDGVRYRVSGYIYRSPTGLYFYRPKGTKHKGELFATLALCVASLQDESEQTP